MKNKMIIASIITFYLLFIFDITATFTSKTKQTTIKYIGLLWVALDHYTIKKYHSDYTPMKWIEITKHITE